MSSDPNAPLLVGAGQLSSHDAGDTPCGLIAEAARRALADTGAAARLLRRIESIAVPYCFTWPLPDPAAAVAAELGADPAETVRSGIGGTAPLTLLADACERIQSGELDVALICGGEAVDAFKRAAERGSPPDYSGEGGGEPDRVLGADPLPPGHERELAVGLKAPVDYYPLFEHAVRAAAGRGVDEHQRWLGRLWERVGAPARDNPHAWRRDVPPAEEIATPSASNRLVADPYTKLLTANIQVDQGAALVVCSQRAAQRAGIAPEGRVHVRVAAAANERWFAGERDRLDRARAIGAAARAALPAAGLGIDEIEHLDLYSCFPSAVQIAARELGLDPEAETRELGVTGGLTFAGGPANNYCSHSLATMVGRIRERGGAGLLTGVGWYMSKHALVVLSADPGEGPFRRLDVQAEVDAGPSRALAGEGASGAATLESYTAVYERDGRPGLGIVAALTAGGERAFACSDRPATIARLLERDPIGSSVELDRNRFEL